MKKTNSSFEIKKAIRPWTIFATSNGRRTTFTLQSVIIDGEYHGFICYGAKGVRKKDFLFYGESVGLAVKAIEANYGVIVNGWEQRF